MEAMIYIRKDGKCDEVVSAIKPIYELEVREYMLHGNMNEPNMTEQERHEVTEQGYELVGITTGGLATYLLRDKNQSAVIKLYNKITSAIEDEEKLYTITEKGETTNGGEENTRQDA